MENVSNQDFLSQIELPKPTTNELTDEKQDIASPEPLEVQASRVHLDQIQEEHRLALEELNRKLSQTNEELFQSKQLLIELERELAFSQEKACSERECNVSKTCPNREDKETKVKRQMRKDDDCEW